MFVAVAPGGDMPAPLPPPPELLDYIPYDIDGPESRVAVNQEETRQALEPPRLVETVSTPVESVPVTVMPTSVDATFAEPLVTYSSSPMPAPRAPLTDLTVSPPSRYAREDYLNLPMDDAGIPGVVLPEMDDVYLDAGSGLAVASRPAEIGMSIRQLEPYFALAKGSESAAIEAGRAGENELFREQAQKAIDAYNTIIEMGDASTEAREEAWYGIARCEYRLGHWWRSFDALERSFPKRFERGEVEGRIKLEMFIAERLWKIETNPVPETSPDGEPLTGYQAASRVYAAAIFNQPSAKDAPLALLRRGDAAYMDKDWDEAIKYYRQAIEYYPESEAAMQARSSLVEANFRKYEGVPSGIPEDGRKDFGNLMDDVERAPALSPEAEERRRRVTNIANDLEAEQKLRHAKIYLKQVRMKKSRDAAVTLLGDVVSHYPGTVHADEAAELLRGMGIEPPMVLSDGSRFPITGGWSGRDYPEDMEGISGGSVQLEGQDAIGSGMLPSSPSRETVFDAFAVPGINP